MACHERRQPFKPIKLKNISSFSGCSGCGVCAAVCPKHVIDIRINAEGFYEPSVDEAGCVACGLCVACCSYVDDEVASFRRYVRKFNKEENFFFLDFFCHGVPSMRVGEKYVRQAETVVGKLTEHAFATVAEGQMKTLGVLNCT